MNERTDGTAYGAEWVRIDPERVRQGDRVHLVRGQGRWEDSITFTVARREDYDWGRTLLKSMTGRAYYFADDGSDWRVDAAWRRMSGWGMGDVPCTAGFHRAATGMVFMFDGSLYRQVTAEDGHTPARNPWQGGMVDLLSWGRAGGWFPTVPVTADFIYDADEDADGEEER